MPRRHLLSLVLCLRRICQSVIGKRAIDRKGTIVVCFDLRILSLIQNTRCFHVFFLGYHLRPQTINSFCFCQFFDFHVHPVSIFLFLPVLCCHRPVCLMESHCFRVKSSSMHRTVNRKPHRLFRIAVCIHRSRVGPLSKVI